MKCNQSRIWTRVAVSNSCDDNHYTTGINNIDQCLDSQRSWLGQLKPLIKFNDYLLFLTEVLEFTIPCAWVGYDTKSPFKLRLTDLSSEFYFSSTVCISKAKEHSLSSYLSIARGRIIGFIPFVKVSVQCWYTISLVQDLNSYHRVHFPFPTTITITSRIPPTSVKYIVWF